MSVSQKVNWTKKITLFASFILLAGFIQPSIALPPEMEADRLLISAAQHTDIGDHSAAAKDFKKILNLKVKLPAEFYFHYGRHFYKTEKLKEASKNIEIYLKKAGRKGQFYGNSLQLLTAIEQDLEYLSRFVVHGDGTITDTKTVLMWAAKDNGSSINWYNAKAYCENYTGGGHTDWRLPTQDELANLYDRKYKNRHGYHVTKLINLSGCCPWASETRGSLAAFFCFAYGTRYWYSQSDSSYYRALPVRGGN